MRQGFSHITSGWTLVDDVYELTERIERAANWIEANGPLQPDEAATIRLMIESQVARAYEEGVPPANTSAVPMAGSEAPLRSDIPAEP
jgi:hypothetical protein